MKMTSSAIFAVCVGVLYSFMNEGRPRSQQLFPWANPYIHRPAAKIWSVVSRKLGNPDETKLSPQRKIWVA